MLRKTSDSTRRFLVIVAACLPLMLQGCASSPERYKDPLAASAGYAQFMQGQYRLECVSSCAGSWGAVRTRSKALYDQGLWQDLATLVISIGHRSDLTYFYLGRAAEGLGQPQAASTYYRLSNANEYKCDGIFNVCQGIDVPSETRSRLAGLPKPAEEPKAPSQLLPMGNPPASVVEAPPPKPRPSMPSPREYLEDVLRDRIAKGSPLSYFWCEKSKPLETDFISPRSYKILSEIYADDKAASYTIQVESSNRGGMPVVADWSVSLAPKDDQSKWCISLLMQRRR